MASRGRSKGKGKRDGMTLQLPPHVQNTMNKEDRLLQQTLDDLQRETKHLFKCISQDQQVAATKLRLLEKRLEYSKARSQSAMSVDSKGMQQSGSISRSLSRKDTCSTDYFKSLLTPAVKDNFSALMDEETSTSHTSKGLGDPPHPVAVRKKSSMKRSAGAHVDSRGTSHSGATQSDRPVFRKSVSFSIKSVGRTRD